MARAVLMWCAAGMAFRARAALALVLGGMGMLACGSGPGGNGDASDAADAAVDITTVDHPAIDGSPVDPCGPAPCAPVELCGTLEPDGGIGSGNGYDDNCNGQVDETCLCVSNTMRSCFPGPPDRRNIGACHDGTMICGELGTWMACSGAITPTPEVCDGVDNDCDGRVDQDLPGCVTAVHCPAYDSANPLTTYTIDGAVVDPQATSWSWRLECPANVSPCPGVIDPSARVLMVPVLQSGRYVVHGTFADGDGDTTSCVYPLYVRGNGLRVELDWDTEGGDHSSGVDLDLHVAPIDPTRAAAAAWFTLDDCYYATCAAPGGQVNWRTSATDTRFAPNPDVTACSGAPAPAGAAWQAAGQCWNPRLDLDDITCDPTVTDATSPGFCTPENINVDVPPDDVVFRLAVNFYRDHGTCLDGTTANDVTHPRLVVYCAGGERAEIGGVDEGEVSMPCGENQDFGSLNWTWLAADVQFGTDACGLEDCTVRLLHATPGEFVACGAVGVNDDTCQDAAGRVFVRRAAERPIDADLPSAF